MPGGFIGIRVLQVLFEGPGLRFLSFDLSVYDSNSLCAEDPYSAVYIIGLRV